MRLDHFLAFTKATRDLFHDMFHLSLKIGEMQVCDGPSWDDLAAIIALEGDANGALALTLNESTAKEITALFFNSQQQVEESDIRDVLGEIVNIIAGSAKAYISDLSIKLTLPQVYFPRNKNDSSSAASGNTPSQPWGPGQTIPFVRVPIETTFGKFSLFCGIESQKQPKTILRNG